MPYHIPVMVNQTVDYLITDKNATYLDGTLGGGGHSAAFLKKISRSGHLVALDRDSDAIAQCRDRFEDDSRITMHQLPFSCVDRVAKENTLQGAMFDLGVSSHQLDMPERGFSHQSSPEVLDMRMDVSEGENASDYIHRISESELAAALGRNADLKNCMRLARAIKKQWQTDCTPHALRTALEEIFGRNNKKLNTLLSRVFQAIRMEVNRELAEIRKGLNKTVACLKVGGRIAVLTYHSVEDRTVKKIFAELERDCLCDHRLPVCVCGGKHRVLKKITKKPQVPDGWEISQNNRARSAKLRVMEKVGTSNARSLAGEENK